MAHVSQLEKKNYEPSSDVITGDLRGRHEEDTILSAETDKSDEDFSGAWRQGHSRNSIGTLSEAL